jgi:glutamine amidotransferase
VRRADRVVFPGVGAAGEAMRNLRDLGLDTAVTDTVATGTPFLGICLGYQILFEHSAEDDQECLGVFRGRVVPFARDMPDPDTGRPLKIPEMGWNRVRFQGTHPIWDGVPPDSEFYFVHSYYPEPRPGVVAARTDYGIDYACGVLRDRVAAFQFHPEKSGRPGLRLLDNFCRWTPGQ